MKNEQITILVFLVLGIVFSVVSNYFSKTLENLMVALLVPPIFYIIVLAIFLKMLKEKKPKMIFYDSIITFILVWITFWILLFNL